VNTSASQLGNNYVIRSFKGNLARIILDERRIPKGSRPASPRLPAASSFQLNNADDLGDLAVPPGNRFEALKGNLADRYSIRINDQWRIVFRWTSVGPEEVEIWPAPGSEDTELGVLMELEVGHGETEVYTRV
jgi:toxin HigB-1